MKSSLLIIAAIIAHTSLAQIAPTHVEASGVETVGGTIATRGELLIRWRSGVSTERRTEVLDDLDARSVRYFERIDTEMVRFSKNRNLTEMTTAARSYPEIELSSPNYRVEPGQRQSKLLYPITYLYGNDPARFRQWWWYRTGVSVAHEYAWERRNSVLVGIVEGGADLNHPDLVDNLWVNLEEENGKAGEDDDGNGYIDDIRGFVTEGAKIQNWLSPQDDAQFGTNIAGVIGARPGNDVGVAGIGLYAKIIPAKAMWGNGYFLSDLLPAIEYCAANKVEFIYMGFTTFDADILRPIITAGNFVSIVAAGGSAATKGKNLDQVPIYPASYNGDNIVTVASSNDWNKRFTKGENYGVNTVDISAPGEFVYTTANIHADYYTLDSEYGYSNRSEIAAAMVTGAAALVKGAHPQLTNREAIRLILDTVDQKEYLVGKVKNAGSLNVARAVLGRSTGGALTDRGWITLSGSGPGARSDHRMVYDYWRNCMVLFGGSTISNKQANFLGDTWELYEYQWKQVATDGPPARYAYAMAYDHIRRITVLYGGFCEGGADHSTWEWDGVVWKEIRTAHFPGDTRGVSMAYDGPNRRMLLVTPFTGETWAYDGTDWHELSIKSFGKLKGFATVVYNGAQKKLVLTGFLGVKQGNPEIGWWEFDGIRWKSRGLFPCDIDAGQDLVYDHIYNDMFAFGGGPGHGLQRFIWTVDKNGVQPILSTFQVSRQFAAVACNSRMCTIVFQGGYSSDNDHGKTIAWKREMPDSWIDNLPVGASDYTGDGKADMALWRPENGSWLFSNSAPLTLGKRCDVPVPGDYDGDGKAEPAVWRRTEGLWITKNRIYKFGEFNDIPVPADYDGDGKTDIAVWRPSDGSWIIKGQPTIRLGPTSGQPVPADYDGDGAAERAVFEPSIAMWYIEGRDPIAWGYPGDSPVPADYAGNRQVELAVYSPRYCRWEVRDNRKGKRLFAINWGNKFDIPVPGDYQGDSKAELGTYNPDTGMWKVYGGESRQIGRIGDVPLVRGR